MYNLQLKLEQDCYTAMIAKLRKGIGGTCASDQDWQFGEYKGELVKWLDTLKLALENEFNGRSNTSTSNMKDMKDSGYYLALLSALDPEKISIIVIQELMKISLYEPYFLAGGDDSSTPVLLKGPSK